MWGGCVDRKTCSRQTALAVDLSRKIRGHSDSFKSLSKFELFRSQTKYWISIACEITHVGQIRGIKVVSRPNNNGFLNFLGCKTES